MPTFEGNSCCLRLNKTKYINEPTHWVERKGKWKRNILICLSCPWQLVDIIDNVEKKIPCSYGWDVWFVIMRDAAGWWSCSRCWPRLDCSCRVVLISVQHPIVYWSGSEKLMMVLTWQVQSCLDDTRQNRLLVRLTSPGYTQTASRFSESRLLLGSLTGPTPVFRSCSEESLQLLRGAADRHYRALQAQSYLYSLYRFTLTHHGAGGSIQSVAAHHWDKTILSCFVPVMATRGKRKHHLHMTVDCKTDMLLLHFYISPFFKNN